MSRSNDLTQAVINLCALHGGHAWRNNNQPRFDPKTKKAYYPNKSSIGTPDVIAMLPNGVTLWIEIKVGKDKLRPSQERFRDKCEELGHKYIVVHDSAMQPELMAALEAAKGAKR